jgi:ABC-type lipoprotein release transport system permease subunit
MNATFRSLLARPRRTLLTIAGVAVAAGSYMLFVGSARGFLEQFRELAVVFGADVVVQQAGATSPWNSVLPEAQVRELRDTGTTATVSRLGLGKARIVGAPFFLVFGLDPAEALLARTLVVRGRTLLPGADEILLGVQAAARLRMEGGTEIDLRGRRLRVVGVFRTGHRVLDAGGVVDLAVAQQLFNLNGSVSLAFLDLDDRSTAAATAALIRKRLPGVEVSTASEWVESYGQLVVVEDFARFLALLALLVAGLGISNVLHVSVGERTQELALLRAIGWSRQRIATQILFETTLVTIAGAVAAVPIAELVLFLIASARVGSMETAGFLPPHLSFAVVLEGTAVSALAGALGALGPLRRAIRVRPAVALRGI